MRKIPLESTIGGSYAFLFQNIVSIIGTIWFPALLCLAIIGAFVWGIAPSNWLRCDFAPPADIQGFVRERLPLIVLAFPVLLITGLLASAMVRVGILRHALGEKTTTTWIWFSLGSRVWRMIGVMLLYIVIYVGIEIAVMLCIALVNLGMVAIPGIPHVVKGLVTAVFVISGIIGGLYIMLRLFFFLPAVVVAENKVGVGRAWELGKGNVWRIIVVLLVAVVPAAVIAGIALYATVLTTVIAAAVSIHDQPQTPQQAMVFLKSLLPVLPVVLGVYLAAAIAIGGLVMGAIGKAYKAVTAPDEVGA